MSTIRALVIAPQPFFTPRGTPFSVYYRTLIMAEKGLQIDLITYGEGHDVIIPNVNIYRIPRFAGFGKVKIGPSPLKLFLDIFIVFWTLFFLIKKKYDIVHCHEESIFFCQFVKPVFKFKLIYDMHSSLPQQLTNFQFTNSKTIISIFKLLEDSALRNSDAVITICPDLSEYVENVITDPSKHVMIENSLFEPVRLAADPDGTDHRQDDTKQHADLLRCLSKEPKLIVYAGTLEHYQGIDILINAFRRVCSSEPEAKLLIAGGTSQQIQHYRHQARQLNIDHAIIFTGTVPQYVAQRFSRMAAVQVSPRSAGTNTPLKIYEQMASGTPLVATNIYSHTQTIDSEVAILVDPNPDAMSSGILRALQSEGLVKSISSAAVARYQNKYSRPVYEKKIAAVIEILGLCAESVA